MKRRTTGLLAAALLAVLLLAGCVLWLIWTVAGLLRRRDGRAFGRRLLALAAVLLWLWCGFCWMWNAAYYASSFQERSGLNAELYSVETLAQVTALFAQRAAEFSTQVERFETGRFAVSRDEILARGPDVYENVAREYPFLALEGQTAAKPIFFSRLQSRLGFTGVYFACVGESNVNVDSPACLLPSTIAHELAHQRGVAWEQECNFLGVLASVTSGMPDYIYSGWLLGFIHLGNALYETDPEAYWAIRGTLPAAVEADLRDNSAYWDQFRDNVVEKVSDTVYDAALKSYGDANGMKSYSMVVELLVAYYKDLV